MSLGVPFWTVFLAIAIIGAITWLAIFEHKYHPWIYRYSQELSIWQSWLKVAISKR